MQTIYEKIKTPFTYGPVLKADGVFYDSPVVFKHKGKFYLTWVEIDAECKTGKESIFLAVSKDGLSWKRYGDKAIIHVEECDLSIITNGDPEIVLLDGYYVMSYFNYNGKHASNTFAVSEDLIHWTKWTGTPLIQSEYLYENVYAHKTWILKVTQKSLLNVNDQANSMSI